MSSTNNIISEEATQDDTSSSSVKTNKTLARKTPPCISKVTRQLVWNRHMGARNGIGYCYCCRATIINAFDFEAGHVQARARGGGDEVENLRPICGNCNRSMGTENLIDFQKRNGFVAAQSYSTALLYWLGTFFNGRV